MSIQSELCVASVQAARIASDLSLDRIETCTALEAGGLTPTPGFVSWIRNTFDLEQHVLIRQRAGGFVYSYDEILVMRDDILAMQQLGVKGVVVGALGKNGQPDPNALEAFHRAAGNLDLTFHRAFDDIKDWKPALDYLVKLGFKRILTSGGQPNVTAGMERLREIADYAAGRIEIMAGGGVNVDNVEALIQTGVSAIHFSGTKTVQQDEQSLFSAGLAIPDRNIVEAVVQKIKSAGNR